jgi:hypothetical protein
MLLELRVRMGGIIRSPYISGVLIYLSAEPRPARAVTMSDRLTDRLISPPAPATAGKRADTHAGTSAEASTQRDSGRRRLRPSALTDTERESIHAAVDALPPMTDEQIDAIAESIIAARERRRRTRQTGRGPPPPSPSLAIAIAVRPRGADHPHPLLKLKNFPNQIIVE